MKNRHVGVTALKGRMRSKVHLEFNRLQQLKQREAFPKCIFGLSRGTSGSFILV